MRRNPIVAAPPVHWRFPALAGRHTVEMTPVRTAVAGAGSCRGTRSSRSRANSMSTRRTVEQPPIVPPAPGGELPPVGGSAVRGMSRRVVVEVGTMGESPVAGEEAQQRRLLRGEASVRCSHPTQVPRAPIPPCRSVPSGSRPRTSFGRVVRCYLERSPVGEFSRCHRALDALHHGRMSGGAFGTRDAPALRAPSAFSVAYRTRSQPPRTAPTCRLSHVLAAEGIIPPWPCRWGDVLRGATIVTVPVAAVGR